MLSPNRTAVVVTAKEPFLEGLHSIDPTNHGVTLEDLNREVTVCLSPEAEGEEEAKASLAVMCGNIFEDQLDGWWRETEDWPRHRTFSTFQQWFDCRIHLLIVDLCDQPLFNEEL